MVVAKSSVQLSTSEYVSHVSVVPNYVVAALTDGTIAYIPISEMSASPLDRKAVSTLRKAPNEFAPAGLAGVPSTPMALASCNTRGRLNIWDLRAKTALQHDIEAIGTDKVATAMGVSNFGDIAIGTEAGLDAEISVFDIRQIKATKPLVKYSDSHNDDITNLQFHPNIPNRMLSGSSDGVVNLFDITVQEEDEAVLEAYNHQASIHRTGFFTDADSALEKLQLGNTKTGLSKDFVFALSHMETLTVFPIDWMEDGNEALKTSTEKKASAVREFGDLRSAWNCQYVADYSKQHFLIGSNDDRWASLIPILNGQPQAPYLLEGGHGDDVVRCFDLWQPGGACFTGGEDGCIKLWDIQGRIDQTLKLTAGSEKTSHESKTHVNNKKSKRILKRSDPLKRNKS